MSIPPPGAPTAGNMAMSMLVVDADVALRQAVESLLAALHAGPVMTASRVQDARALMACVRFDLVVMDIQLTPGSAAPDGIPVLVAAAEAGTPVILHTSADPERLRTITRAPVHAWLRKPAPADVLRTSALGAFFHRVAP